MISLAQYFAGFDINAVPEGHRKNAIDLLDRVNQVLDAMRSDGVTPLRNPKTDCYVSGNGHGGYRAQDTTVGADKSKHKTGQGVDVYDPYRELSRWVWKNKELVASLGLHIERSEWTPTWVHFQNVAPASGVFAFIPNSSPALAPALAEQSGVA